MARPPSAVVDASVAAKWLLQEPGGEEARVLRNAHVDGTIFLLTPALAIVEVENALRYHPRIGSDTLAEHITALHELDLGLDPVSEPSVSGPCASATAWASPCPTRGTSRSRNAWAARSSRRTRPSSARPDTAAPA